LLKIHQSGVGDAPVGRKEGGEGKKEKMHNEKSGGANPKTTPKRKKPMQGKKNS